MSRRLIALLVLCVPLLAGPSRAQTRSPVAEMTNAPVQALYVPAIKSRHGSLVSIVSRTRVSQTSVSCSRKMSIA